MVFRYPEKVSLAAANDPWQQAGAILARIRVPVFPKRDFEITRYGAASGAADCTEAIARAISECSQAGGGRVVVPAGVWLTGAIHLRSNVELYLAAGATLLFSRDPRHYLPLVYTRWEGTECLNYSHSSTLMANPISRSPVRVPSTARPIASTGGPGAGSRIAVGPRASLPRKSHANC